MQTAESIVIVQDHAEKRDMANWAENFFMRMNEEKHQRQEYLNRKVFNLETKGIKKLLKIIHPHISKYDGGYMIRYDGKGTVFTSKSDEDIYKKWKSYKYNRAYTHLSAYIGNKKLYLSYYYSIISDDIDEFFSNHIELLHSKLIALDRWVYKKQRKFKNV